MDQRPVRRAAAFFALAAVAALAACSRVDTSSSSTTTAATGDRPIARGPGAQPHVLRIGDNQDVAGLNPAIVASVSLGNLSQLTLAYLARYGPDNRPVPDLATEIPTQANGGISKDGLTITYHLRQGVKWSDGVPFDGDDVVWSFNAVNNPKNNVTGRDGFDRITKIDEPDKFTVTIHLKRPYSAYLPTFFGSAGANPPVMPKHLLANLPDINNAPFNAKPVGIGPFRYVEWVRGDHITLERNPYWYGDQAKLDKIIYKFVPDLNTLLNQMKSGEIDLWPYTRPAFYDQVKTIPTATVLRQPGYIFQHIDFNVSHPPLDDKVVRQALRLAIDRQTIRDKGNHGTGTLQESMVTQASPWYEPIESVPFDIAQANKLLDGDGWTRGADGVRLKNGKRLALVFAIGSGNSDVDQQVELIRATWQQIGVAIEVRHYAQALYFAPFAGGGILQTGKFDVADYAWQITPDGEQPNLYASRQFPPNGQNMMRYKGAAADKAFEDMDGAYDEADRKKLITVASKAVVDDVPTVVLYVRDDIHTVNNAVTGWKPNSTTSFDHFETVDIK